MITDPLREEHQRLLPHVQQLSELADAVGDAPIRVLRAGVERAHAFLTQQLLPHAEAEHRVLSPTVAPKEIESSATLPQTRSGKIMRRLFKARELGLPEGDTSALEPS